MDDFECLTLQNISKMDVNQDFAQKYLEYLVTLIHLNKPIDFIQAALVMQTLSSVFAKKVDHLQEQILAFTIVFRKLELGNNNVDDENGENNEGQERGKASKKKNIEKEIIMHAFENVCSSNNIRKNCIKKWSDKDIKKVDPYALRNKINECPKIKTKELFSCYIYDNKLDKLGKKEEFGVNGFLCNNLIPKDDFCLSCTHTQDLWKLNDTANVSVFPIEAEQPRSHDCMNIDNAASPIHNDNEHSYQDVVEQFINNSFNDKDDSISGHVYFEKINQVQERLVDVGGIYNILWSPVDDNNKQLERKIKKRNVKSIPEDIKKEINDTKDFRSPYPSEYVLSDLMLAIFKLKSNVPLHPHFTNSLRLEKDRRAKHISRKNSKRVKGAVTDHKNGDFKGFNEFGDDNIDNNLFEHELDVACGDSPDHNIEDNSFCNNDNYMQDAIQHIREYQQGIQYNQHEDTINEIALKVSAWHDSIRPHLEREEGRTNFDIHEYGSKILQQFPQSNAKTTLSFADCIQNQPREEIPRYFLSSLLLANSYNVEISKSNPDELSVNDMMLTLLSRVRQHELLDEGMRKEFS